MYSIVVINLTIDSAKFCIFLQFCYAQESVTYTKEYKFSLYIYTHQVMFRLGLGERGLGIGQNQLILTVI